MQGKSTRRKSQKAQRWANLPSRKRWMDSEVIWEYNNIHDTDMYFLENLRSKNYKICSCKFHHSCFNGSSQVLMQQLVFKNSLHLDYGSMLRYVPPLHFGLPAGPRQTSTFPSFRWTVRTVATVRTHGHSGAAWCRWHHWCPAVDLVEDALGLSFRNSSRDEAFKVSDELHSNLYD